MRDRVRHVVEKNSLLSRVFAARLRAHYEAKDAAADHAALAYLRSRNFMPTAVLIQISRACNLRCTMCGWAVWQRNRGYMKLELYKHILDELESNSIRQVNLTNPQGEPLLSPHAIECISLAVTRGFEVNLNTNCTPLGDKNIDQLCELARSGRLRIQASFSGHDKGSHEAIYVGSKFEASSGKLRALNEKLSRIGLAQILTVNGIIMDRRALQKSVDYLISLGIDKERITIGLPDNFAGIVQVGRRNRNKGFYSYKSDLPYRSLRLCNLLASYVLIYDDGKVSACSCRDSEGVMEIGDITRQSLAEIRNGPKFMEMLAGFMERDISRMPLCLKCDIPYGDYENEKLFVSGAAAV